MKHIWKQGIVGMIFGVSLLVSAEGIEKLPLNRQNAASDEAVAPRREGGWAESFAISSAIPWESQGSAYRTELERPNLQLAPDAMCELLPDWEVLAQAGGSVTPSSVHIFADGKELPVTVRPDFRTTKPRLFFTVPSPCLSLTMYFGGQTQAPPAANIVELLPNVLSPRGWNAKEVTVEAVEGINLHLNGLLLTAKLGGERQVFRDFPVPAGIAGRKALLEAGMQSQARLPWGCALEIQQLDAKGKPLVSTVSDTRWMSMMQPLGTYHKHLEIGLIDPRAKTLRVTFRLQAREQKYDLRGEPLQNPDDATPRLKITHLSLRPAEELPFPRYNDVHFAPGVSGKPGDYAFRFHQEKTALYCPLTPHGHWGEGKYCDPNTDYFFPTDNGTAELWLQPSWKTAASDTISLLETATSNGRDKLPFIHTIVYTPSKKLFTIEICDFDLKTYKKTIPSELPENQWSHLAFQWSKQGIQLFLNGKCLLNDTSFSFAPYVAKKADIGKKTADLRLPQILALGAHRMTARFRLKSTAPAFVGLMDQLRVWDGTRYTQDFDPQNPPPPNGALYAAFDFDHNLEGTSAKGPKYLEMHLGSFQSRIADTMVVEAKDGSQRTLRVYPETNPPSNDPGKVFNIRNYPVIPDTEDFLQARITHVLEKRFHAGETISIPLPQDPVYMDSITIQNPPASNRLLQAPLVIRDGEIDPRSFADIADSLQVDSLSQRQRADKLFQWLISSTDYFIGNQIRFDDHSRVPVPVMGNDALAMLNNYCGFECGPLNNLAANLFTCAGKLPATQTSGYAHSFEQVFFDGKLHVYDLSAQKFFPSHDNRTPASLSEMELEQAPFGKITPVHSSSHFIRMMTRGTAHQVPMLQKRVAYDLRPGETFRIWFCNDGVFNDLESDNAVKWERADKVSMNELLRNPGPANIWKLPRIFPHFSTAELLYDGKPRGLAFEPSADSFIYTVRLPYTIVAAEVAAFDGTAPIPVEVSIDRQEWTPLVYEETAKLPSNRAKASMIYEVRARNLFYLRVKAPLAKCSHFYAKTTATLNPRLLTGALKPGDNPITLKASSGDAIVTFQYRTNAQPVDIRAGVRWGTLKGWERQLVVLNPGKALTIPVGNWPRQVTASQGLQAVLENGSLQLSVAPDARLPLIGTVTLQNGKATKVLSVLAAEHARLCTVANATCENAEREPIDPLRPNPAIGLHDIGARVAFQMDEPIPAGNYIVMQLHRVQVADMVAGGNGDKSCSYFLQVGDKQYAAGWPMCNALDFYKASYGSGKWSRFSWCFPKRRDYPYYVFLDIPLPETRELVFVKNKNNPLELAAALVMPAPSYEFRLQLRSLLGSLNYAPWLIRSQSTRDADKQEE
ncbi:MAG: hypothetical protein IJJ26_01585 [Victivallales bacterium]|nr:hypothetical protein [Victivallales bacterium]